MPTPRRHHYVPKSYLAAWTDTGTQDGQLHVHDKSNGKSWLTRPINAAKEGDLYMLDLSDLDGINDPVEIEIALGKVESEAMQVIRSNFQIGSILSADTLRPVLALAATLTVRSPRAISNLEGYMKDGYIRGSANSYASDALPAQLNAVIETVMNGHQNTAGRPSGMIRNEALAISFSQCLNYFAVFERLRWIVSQPEANAGDIRCSDRPIVIDELQIMPDGSVLRNGNAPPRVLFPLSPQVALLGHCLGDTVQSELTREFLDVFNRRISDQAERFVFSPPGL